MITSIYQLITKMCIHVRDKGSKLKISTTERKTTVGLLLGSHPQDIENWSILVIVLTKAALALVIKWNGEYFLK